MQLKPFPQREAAPPTRLPFRIRTLGRVQRDARHVTAGTYHQDAMLTVVLSGTGHYHLKGSVERIGRGWVGLVLPDTDPGLLMADAHDPYGHYFCRFTGSEALRMARAISARYAGTRFFRHPGYRQAAALLESMLALEGNTGAAQPEWMSPTEGELARLLSVLLLDPATDDDKLSEATLRRYLLAHVAQPLNLRAMAEQFGVSRSHLSRKAHELLGERLSRVSRRQKLELACSLLETSSVDFTIAEIARRVGYEDPLYFSKVFRRHVGLSPSRYHAARAKGR